MSRTSPRFNSIQQRSENSAISSLFCGLRQLKNGFSEELQKMRARFGLLRFGKEYNEPCMCHTNAMMQAEIQKAECEICTDSLTAKAIYSCISCHNVLCVLCLRRVRSCPFCRKTGIFAQRNYALERFLTTLNLPCRNQRYGCKELVDRNTRDFHEKNCDYAPVNCPYFYECNWSGEQEALRTHLQEFHSISLINNNHSQVKIKSLWSKIKTTTNKKKTYTMILYCYNSIFLCKISLFKNTLNFSFSQVKSNYYYQIEKDNHFGAAVEVSSSLRNVKGVIPLPKPDDVQEIELSPQFILSQEDLGNDEIEISINIKCLDDML